MLIVTLLTRLFLRVFRGTEDRARSRHTSLRTLARMAAAGAPEIRRLVAANLDERLRAGLAASRVRQLATLFDEALLVGVLARAPAIDERTWEHLDAALPFSVLIRAGKTTTSAHTRRRIARHPALPPQELAALVARHCRSVPTMVRPAVTEPELKTVVRDEGHHVTEEVSCDNTGNWIVERDVWVSKMVEVQVPTGRRIVLEPAVYEQRVPAERLRWAMAAIEARPRQERDEITRRLAKLAPGLHTQMLACSNGHG